MVNYYKTAEKQGLENTQRKKFKNKKCCKSSYLTYVMSQKKFGPIFPCF